MEGKHLGRAVVISILIVIFIARQSSFSARLLQKNMPDNVMRTTSRHNREEFSG